MAGPVIPGSEDASIEDGVLVVSQDIAAPPQEVWRCLTAPTCFKSWWRETIEFEPKAGGRFTEPWVDPSGRERTTTAQVTAFHPPSGFVMVWADEDWEFDTVVTVSLAPIEEGTRVIIEHQGWEKAPEPDRSTMFLDQKAVWGQNLGKLAAYAEAHDTGPGGPGEGH